MSEAQENIEWLRSHLECAFCGGEAKARKYEDRTFGYACAEWDDTPEWYLHGAAYLSDSVAAFISIFRAGEGVSVQLADAYNLTWVDND